MATVRGISFPFRRAGGEFPAASEDDATIMDSIKQILLVSRFERVMRPSLGSLVSSMLFENNTALLRARLAAEVKRALREQEKRIQVLAVNVADYTDSKVVLDVIYKRVGRTTRATVAVDRPSAGT